MPFDEVKSLVKKLADKLEQSNQKIENLESENIELKNRLRELIGEQELPEFKEKKKMKSKDRDPNSQYKEPRQKGPGRGKRGKKIEKINIDKKVTLEADKSKMPSDVTFKGCRTVVIQDIELKTSNTEFKIPRFYSPSEKKYYEGDLPEGFKGHEFGPNLRAFVLMLNHQARVTENKIHSILSSVGTFISIGHINNITQTIPANIQAELLLAKDTAIEKEAVNVDASGINTNGDQNYLQCICNKFFSWFDLLKNRSRYEVFRSLIGHDKVIQFKFDESSVEWIKGRVREESFLKNIQKITSNKIYTEKEFLELVDSFKSTPKRNSYLLTTGLLTAYRQGYLGVMAKGLISDDAHEYKHIIGNHQLCWIHELRHYRMIKISTGFLKEKLDQFFDRAWKLFDQMKEYKQKKSLKLRSFIEKEFSELFEKKWDCYHIDSLQKNTLRRKGGLLKFLDHPELDIDNNRCEFDIREKVVKKKISYGHKSYQGCINGNFWLSLYHTCRKNKVEFWNYLKDRFSGQNSIPQLSRIIEFNS